MNRTHIDTLKLTSFRNHDSLSLETGGRHVVLFGENGAGKTNILEAISFLSPGRGMRRASYDQIGTAGGNGSWTVFAKVTGAAGDVSIGTGLPETLHGVEKQRKTHINANLSKTSDGLLEHVRVLWLTPAMDGLFTGPAGDRRRFLDRLVLAIQPSHGRRVTDFEKLMRSRNRLLAEDHVDAAWLDATEVQLAEHSVAIGAARQEVVSLLSAAIVRNHDPASPFPDAHITVSGTLEEQIRDLPAAQVEREYLERLQANRAMDARAGRMLEGPHRSDLVAEHRPKAMPAHLCSTGEQKALLTGLVLAHADLVAEMAGFTPILLLDEIAAHLDEGRRAALYDLLDRIGCQSWMSGTDRDLFKALDNRASFFNVLGGSQIVPPG